MIEGCYWIWQVHGILNIIGWGTLIPIGIIIGRYFRHEFPIRCDQWYSIHAVCQTCGYIMGTVGWAFGVSVLHSSSKRSYLPFLVLGIFIILLTTIQVSVIIILSPYKTNCDCKNINYLLQLCFRSCLLYVCNRRRRAGRGGGVGKNTIM